VPRHKRASGSLLNFRVFEFKVAKRTVERPIPIVGALQHEIYQLASFWRDLGNRSYAEISR